MEMEQEQLLLLKMLWGGEGGGRGWGRDEELTFGGRKFF